MLFLNKYWIVFVLLTLISCDNIKKLNTLNNYSANDSIVYYYNASLNNDKSVQEQEKSINKALLLSRNRPIDSLTLKLNYQKNRLLFSLEAYDSLILSHNKLVVDSKLIGDIPRLARAHYLIAYYFDEIEQNTDSAFFNYTLAKNYYQQIHDSVSTGKSLLNLAIIQKNQDDFFGSKETITEAITFFKKDKHKNNLASCYNLLATNHRKLINYTDAITYYLLAIKTSKITKDKLVYKNNLAVTYLDAKQYSRAIKELKQIIKDSAVFSSKRGTARVIDNLAYAKWLSGLSISNKTYNQALELRKQGKDNRGLIASYTHLGEYYTINAPKMASQYFDTVVQLAQLQKMPRAEKNALKQLIKLHPKNLDFRNQYTILQDRIYEEGIKVKTQFAKYKYDDNQKQASILRLEKEKTAKELEATKERNYKTTLFLALLIALLAIIFSLYFFKQRTARLKQETRTAKLEATYETEAQLSRRLHDDFGAKLNHTMLLVEKEAGKTQILNNLESLYQQSRSFSREINEIATDEFYGNELKEMLRFRTPRTAKLYLIGLPEIDWHKTNPLTKIALYKVLQELMINMSKHSHASLVTVSFEISENNFNIAYSDNGIGATKKTLNTKNGLRNTEKRIQAISGTITFDTQKEEGFRANIKIPQ